MPSSRKIAVVEMQRMTPDQRREFLLRLWVGGQSIHNRIENECCPDFSCCRHPIGIPTLSRELREMFLRDPASRRPIIQSVIDELSEKDPLFLAQTDIPGVDVEYFRLAPGTRH